MCIKQTAILWVVFFGIGGLLSPLSAQTIYWTQSGYRGPRIQRASFPLWNAQTLVANSGAVFPNGLAIDTEAGKMYWTTSTYGRIQRANLDGTEVENLPLSGLSVPLGIAIGPVERKLYWTDRAAGKIQRSNLDGSDVQDVTTGLTAPSCVAVDSANGLVYWADWATDKIQRMHLPDGQVEDLVTTGLLSPASIAVDVPAGKLYWGDYWAKRIQRADVNGSNVETLVAGSDLTVQGIALDSVELKLYWIDDHYKRIQRSNLNGTEIEDFVATADHGFPYGLVIDTNSRLLYWTDYGTESVYRAALDGSSSETVVTPVLVAPQRIAFDPSSVSAFYSEAHNYPYSRARIQRARWSRVCVETVVDDLDFPQGVALDPLNQDVYWAGAAQYYAGAILRAKATGGDVEPVAFTDYSDDYPTDLALDLRARRVYWVTELYWGGIEIQRANLDGSDIELLALIAWGYESGGIAVDPVGQRVYWAGTALAPVGEYGFIDSANLDGSDHRELLRGNDFWPSGLALDRLARKLYWASRDWTVRRANLDGSDIEEIFATDGAFGGIAVDPCSVNRPPGLSEHSSFVACIQGPSSLVADPCFCLDYSSDGSVDLADFAIIQRSFALAN